MTKKTPVAPLDGIPMDVLQLVGPPPTLPTEDPNRYYAMIAAFARAIQPHDLITWMLIKDLADHRLEIARYRMIKTGLVKAARGREMTLVDALKAFSEAAIVDLRSQAEREKEQLAKSQMAPRKSIG